jgi:predicted MFS family arabinose efflux permease
MKKPLRDPKVDHEWRTTFLLASVAAFLSVAVRYFCIQATGVRLRRGERSMQRSGRYSRQKRLGPIQIFRSIVVIGNQTNHGYSGHAVLEVV